METDAPEGSPFGEVAGVKVEQNEGSSFEEEVAGVKVEQNEGSLFEEVSELKDVHMEDPGESGKHDDDEAMGSFPPGEEPMLDINSINSSPLLMPTMMMISLMIRAFGGSRRMSWSQGPMKRRPRPQPMRKPRMSRLSKILLVQRRRKG